MFRTYKYIMLPTFGLYPQSAFTHDPPLPMIHLYPQSGSNENFQLILMHIKAKMYIISSVTRLGNFLHFGQPFKAGGNNDFTQIAHIISQFLYRCLNHSFF